MKCSNLTEKDAEELMYFGYNIGLKVGQGTFSKVYKAAFEPRKSPASSILERSRSSSVRYSAAFLAEMADPKPELACKVVEKSYKMPKDYPHRFMQRELNIMTKLKHPYIPKLHSILRKGDKFMIFMTYTARGNLCDYIMANGPVNEPVAQRWIRQITLALIYLHTLDIAHRDISCDNILMTEGWNVKLCDYGYACFNVTVHGWPKYSHTHCGSMPYVAPEIIRGVSYNPKYADIWSLGIVLFVMVNGTFPFTSNSYEIQYTDQMEEKYSFRRCLTISPSVAKKIKSMLEPNPLLRISLQEIMDSKWMKETNSKVPVHIREQEIAAQLEAESTKEYMKLNHDKKLSMQYPIVRIEKETFGKRLRNLMKRYKYKVRCKGHHEEDLHYHYRAKKIPPNSEVNVDTSPSSDSSEAGSRMTVPRSPSSIDVTGKTSRAPSQVKMFGTSQSVRSGLRSSDRISSPTKRTTSENKSSEQKDPEGEGTQTEKPKSSFCPIL